MARQRKATKQAVETPVEQPVVNPVDPPDTQPVKKTPSITAEQIRTMTVIQLRAFIEAENNPELDNLMDVYNRDQLQEKLIERLGL
jgi:hypothetical protein